MDSLRIFSQLGYNLLMFLVQIFGENGENSIQFFPEVVDSFRESLSLLLRSIVVTKPRVSFMKIDDPVDDSRANQHWNVGWDPEFRDPAIVDVFAGD